MHFFYLFYKLAISFEEQAISLGLCGCSPRLSVGMRLHRGTASVRSCSELDLPSRSSTVCSADPNMVQRCPKLARDIGPGLRRDFFGSPGGSRGASRVAGTGGHCLDESIQTCPVRALKHLPTTLVAWTITLAS